MDLAMYRKLLPVLGEKRARECAEQLEVCEVVNGPYWRSRGVLELWKSVPVWDVRAHVRSGCKV